MSILIILTGLDGSGKMPRRRDCSESRIQNHLETQGQDHQKKIDKASR
jgi:hypothetical protein